VERLLKLFQWRRSIKEQCSPQKSRHDTFKAKQELSASAQLSCATSVWYNSIGTFKIHKDMSLVLTILGGNFVAEQRFIQQVPSNIDELKTKSNNKSNWRERLDSVNELKRYDCREARDIIKILALHDPVSKVMEAAFKAAQAFGITKKGKPLYLGKKKKGNLVKGITKILVRVRNSFEGKFSVQDFKKKFKAIDPRTYDTYEGDMGDGFDEWLKDILLTLPKTA